VEAKTVEKQRNKVLRFRQTTVVAQSKKVLQFKRRIWWRKELMRFNSGKYSG